MSGLGGGDGGGHSLGIADLTQQDHVGALAQDAAQGAGEAAGVTADLDLFDGYTADEIFLSSTSLCICPVASMDGRAPLAPGIPGPVTRRLMDGYKDLLQFDFEQQYLQFLKD